jgi:G3E family GTPase
VRRWLRDEALADGPGHDHDHHHDRNRHDGGIAAFAMTFDDPLDWDRVNRWLSALRDRHGDRLLRVKGILNLDGETSPVVVHGVHHVFHSPARLADWPDGDRRSRIVFITRELDEATVRGFWVDVSVAA